MGDFRTSTYLQEQLDDLDLDQDESGSAEDSESISPGDRALLQKLQMMLVESYEAFSSEECERVHRVFSAESSTCEYFLDDYFDRRLTGEVRHIVQRVMRFEPIVVSKVPTGSVNVYLREAVCYYVYGLHQGAVTLARAAMEQGLRERVPCGRKPLVLGRAHRRCREIQGSASGASSNGHRRATLWKRRSSSAAVRSRSRMRSSHESTGGVKATV